MASIRIARSYSVDVAHQEVSPSSSPYHGPAFHTSVKEKDILQPWLQLGVSSIGVITHVLF